MHLTRAEKSRRSVIKRFTSGVGSSCVLPAGVEKPQETTEPGFSRLRCITTRWSDVAILLRGAAASRKGEEEKEKNEREKLLCSFVGISPRCVSLQAVAAAKFAPNLLFQWKCVLRASLINRSPRVSLLVFNSVSIRRFG